MHWSVEILIVVATLVINIWGINRQYEKLQFIKNQLLSNKIDPQLVGDLTSGVTYYTNTVYFNYFTLLMTLSLVCGIGIMLKEVRKFFRNTDIS